MDELELKGERRQVLRRHPMNWKGAGSWGGPGLYVRLPLLPMFNSRAYAPYGDANPSKMDLLNTKLLEGMAGTTIDNDAEQGYHKHWKEYRGQVCDLEPARWGVEEQHRYSGQSKKYQGREEQILDAKTTRDDFQTAGEALGDMDPRTCFRAYSSSSSSNRNRSKDRQGNNQTGVSRFFTRPETFSQTICNTTACIPIDSQQNLCQIHAARPRRLARPENLFKYWTTNENGHSMERENAKEPYDQVTITQGNTFKSLPIGTSNSIVVPPQTVTIAWFHDDSAWLSDKLPTTHLSCLHSAQIAQVVRGLDNVQFRRSESSVRGREAEVHSGIRTFSTPFSSSSIENISSGESCFEKARIAQTPNTLLQWQPPAHTQESHPVQPAYNPQRPHSPYLFNPRYQPDVDQYWDRVFGEYAQHQADQFVLSNPHLVHEIQSREARKTCQVSQQFKSSL